MPSTGCLSKKGLLNINCPRNRYCISHKGLVSQSTSHIIPQQSQEIHEHDQNLNTEQETEHFLLNAAAVKNETKDKITVSLKVLQLTKCLGTLRK